jgi:histone-lysine N-methyltransferase SETMAR
MKRGSTFQTVASANGLSPEDVPVRVKDSIASKKVMIFIAWNPCGFLLVEALPEGTRFNSLFIREILIDKLDAKLKEMGIKNGIIGQTMHWDNARPHISTQTMDLFAALEIATLPHPPYSPDIAPCDLYLFGYLKHCLRGLTFPDSESLVLAIYEIMAKIDKSVYISVYDEWMTRLERVLELSDYYH